MELLIGMQKWFCFILKLKVGHIDLIRCEIKSIVAIGDDY